MCGIAGQVSFNRPASFETVRAMTERIRHRGPDDFGVWSSETGECVLGHTRLSVIDLSPLGSQPMLDPDTGNCITFNGEIYNYRQLRAEREAAGEKFRSNSDTEVLLSLYRKYGTKCLAKLRGMFAFAIWNEQNKQLFLARDRVGKKPLNYLIKNSCLQFCSEIDPLASHSQNACGLDNEALELFLQLQYIPAPWTIYTGIRKLEPAKYVIFDKDGVASEIYWDINYCGKQKVSDEAALDGLEEKLTEAIQLRMTADVPLGALLSGGVDSSVVVALMRKVSGAPIRTYSIGFNEEEFNELAFAKEASQICGTSHNPKIMSGNLQNILPNMARHYGEPFADSSAVPSFFLCEAARQHVTVALNGDGGDELLGGYPRHTLSKAQLAISSALPDFIPGAALALITLNLSCSKTFTARATRKLLTEYLRPELRSVGMYSGFWNTSQRRELLGAQHDSKLIPKWSTFWLENACRRGNNAIDRMLWYDNRTYLAGDLLVKMDIASMHCGLETRSPFLDHEVIEYCASLPRNFKVRHGTGKFLLKKLAERFYPAAFVHRPKMGFGIPLAKWLQGPLKPLLLDLLTSRDLVAPLRGDAIERVLAEFFRGEDYHSSRLWTLLMFAMWKQHSQASH